MRLENKIFDIVIEVLIPARRKRPRGRPRMTDVVLKEMDVQQYAADLKLATPYLVTANRVGSNHSIG